MTYDKAKQSYNGALIFAVDLATGKAVTARTAQTNFIAWQRYGCFQDQSHVVCTAGDMQDPEIIGFDDNTGRKVWGWGGKTTTRIVPRVDTVFHGTIYGEVQNGPVHLDAATGKDVPVPTPTPTLPTPSSAVTPTDGSTPTDSSTPVDGSVPTETPTPDLGLRDSGQQYAPAAVSEYGAIVYREDISDDVDLKNYNWVVIEQAVS